jgi:hypothetical protein
MRADAHLLPPEKPRATVSGGGHDANGVYIYGVGCTACGWTGGTSTDPDELRVLADKHDREKGHVT